MPATAQRVGGPMVAETAEGGSSARWAVVQIYTHGASATIIATEVGRSFLLGCAHAYEGQARGKKMGLVVPWPQEAAPPRPLRATLLAVDTDADLSLVLIDQGPWPWVMPVAPAGHRPARSVLALGYDRMQLPLTAAPATVLTATTFTRERPVPGRSGGALMDAERGWLIGVCQGYEVTGQRRGMYVSHDTVLSFLRRKGYSSLAPGAAQAPVPGPALRVPARPCPT